MHEYLRILVDWLKANKLSLNASETNYILFRNKKSELNYTMQINDQLQRNRISLKTQILGNYN